MQKVGGENYRILNDGDENYSVQNEVAESAGYRNWKNYSEYRKNGLKRRGIVKRG